MMNNNNDNNMIINSKEIYIYTKKYIEKILLIKLLSDYENSNININYIFY